MHIVPLIVRRFLSFMYNGALHHFRVTVHCINFIFPNRRIDRAGLTPPPHAGPASKI